MKNISKILIVHIANNMGGAEYSLCEFLYNLKNIHMEIHLILSSQLIALFKEKIDIPLQFHDINLRYLKKRMTIKDFISFISCNLRLYRLIKKQNITTVYCNTYRSLPYCLIIKSLTKTRIICHCRDNITSKFIKYLIHYCSNECIAVSNNIKNQLVSSHKVNVIHNGINIDSFADRKPTGWLHKKLNLSSDIKIIGNIGQIVPWKNQTDYILVANKLIKNETNLHFLIIGTAMCDKYYRQLQQLILSLNLAAYVTIIGHVNNIHEYFTEIDILLHTAINEPFGRVIAEASAASKPVISYKSGGPSEIIINGKTGFLIQDGDTDQMVEITSRLLTDHTLKKSIGKAAQNHAAKYFDSKDYSHKVYNFLVYDQHII